jgi:inorganic pyrophosphatase
VLHRYPFPYGFIIRTSAADGDNVDCFVVTTRHLRPNQILFAVPGIVTLAVLDYIIGPW